jgi:DNA integrity scanning protein DisA with diadenylate cyclase activity
MSTPTERVSEALNIPRLEGIQKKARQSITSAVRNPSLDAEKQARSWWWMHSVSRVQAQVLKSLVVCYVDVPPITERVSEALNIPRLEGIQKKARQSITSAVRNPSQCITVA